ncbi:hypothetical protein [Mycolicibacterium hodleri]|uniref:hypothetical protein n=1 Tax=Mycolicibacterium hodleri TaxID=49897 RepID=UPI00112AA1E4|nr:hypothetical protein [Mycolicibacterium hodleri]
MAGGQLQHDLKWSAVWATSSIAFAVVGAVASNAVWMGALFTGTAFVIHAIASFNEWRDRRALAKRGHRSTRPSAQSG